MPEIRYRFDKLFGPEPPADQIQAYKLYTEMQKSSVELSYFVLDELFDFRRVNPLLDNLGDFTIDDFIRLLKADLWVSYDAYLQGIEPCRLKYTTDDLVKRIHEYREVASFG